METYFPNPPSYSTEQQLAENILSLAPNNPAIKHTPLANFYLGEQLQASLLAGQVISVNDANNNVYFHKLADDRQTLLSIGPYSQPADQGYQSLVSLLFYSSLALA
ncbi:MAG: hypothetical protein AAGJ33_00995, partial [Pseudomonadota bacterium]